LRRLVDFNNRESQAILINHNTEMLNIVLDFTDTYVNAYKERNRFLIREMEQTNKELEFIDENYFKSTINTLKEESTERKKLGKKMSDEEKTQIERTKIISLDLLKEKLDSEYKLQEEMELKSFELAQKNINDNDELNAEQKEKSIKLLQAEKDLRLAIIKKASEEEIKARQKAYDDLLNEDNGGGGNKKLQEFLSIFNQANELAQVLGDIAITQQENMIDRLKDNLSRFDEQISESASRLSDLESDLEGKQSGRRDAVLRGIEIEKQRQAELAAQKIKLEQQIAKEEKKLANQRKAAAITQAIINGALAITNIFATVPKAD
jgi:hypothetical protein